MARPRTSVAMEPDRRDYLKSLGRKGDDYNDIVDAIEELIKKHKVSIPITPP